MLVYLYQYLLYEAIILCLNYYISEDTFCFVFYNHYQTKNLLSKHKL
jgi:hypothetical protein